MNLRIETNQDLKVFTTFGIGGKAAFFAEVKTKEDLKEAFLFASQKKLPLMMLGKGSNLLFDDAGFSGLVVFNQIDFLKTIKQRNSCLVQVGSGYSLTELTLKTLKENYSGLEFALGIPASIGGAVYMNAGAFGSSIGDLVQEADFLFEDGTERVFFKHELEFGYRFSSFKKLFGSIVSVKLLLSSMDQLDGLQKKEQVQRAFSFLEKRQKSQPLQTKNAGSVFRNPKGFFAAELIEKSNLKGFQIGDAEVSTLHANFIINKKAATSKDVLALIEHVKKTVFEKHRIMLEEEVIYVPFQGRLSE